MPLLVGVLDHRSHRRPVFGSWRETATNWNMPATPGLNVVPPAAVVVKRMRHRSNYAVTVRNRSQMRQMLADQQSRGAAGNRLERTANLRRRVRLHIECFKLAGATKQEQKDHGLGASCGTATQFRLITCGQQSRQRQAGKQRPPRLKDLAPWHSVTYCSSSAGYCEHLPGSEKRQQGSHRL